MSTSDRNIADVHADGITKSGVSSSRMFVSIVKRRTTGFKCVYDFTEILTFKILAGSRTEVYQIFIGSVNC